MKSAHKIAKTWYKKAREDASCSVCGEDHPAVLEFHHRDPSQKVASISRMVKEGRPLADIFAEAAKCDIVCANDHKIIHWNWKIERELGR